jgi:hypothetical protein
MGESGSDTVVLSRDGVESLLGAVRKIRSAFNPDAGPIKEGAPGLAAFVERLDRSAARLEALLQRTDGSSGSVAVDRDNAELVLAGLRRWSAAFNPDKSVLKEGAPGLAAFAERLEQSAGRIAAAL